MLDSNVLFYCDCYKSPVDIRGGDLEEDVLDLSDPRSSSALYPLEYLYFCDDCQVHKCPRCVIEEVVSIFCPQCLYEVPSKPGSTDSVCKRNCLRCPECQSIVKPDEGQDGDIQLRCRWCKWSMDNAGMRLTSTHLVLQTSKEESRREELYDNIVEHLESMRDAQPISREAQALSKYKSAITPTQSFKPILLSDPRTAPQVMPSTVSLRSKRLKRCRQCRLLLVKPDSKPMSITFRSRLYGNKVLPTISFEPVNELIIVPGARSEWNLKLTNPLPEKCQIVLSTKNRTDQGDRVTILCPSFVLGPDSEVWDSSMELATSSRSGSLHDIGRNYATVRIEVIAADRSGPQIVRIPVLVQLNYEQETQAGAKDPRMVSVWIVLETRSSSW